MRGMDDAKPRTPPAYTTTIEISKEYLHFAAAHFTLFSARERENLHGHNFYVTAQAQCHVGPQGLAFDYNELKMLLKMLCDDLDETTLLPAASPWLSVREDGAHVRVEFADEQLVFLARDAKILPLANITVEELAEFLLQRVLADDRTARLQLTSLVIRVSSGPGQWARAEWPAAAARPG